MTKEEFFELADRYHRGVADEKEVRLFEEFLDRMQNPAVPDSMDPEQQEKMRTRLLSKINRHVNKEAEKGKKQPWKWIGIAAAVLFITASFLFLLSGSYSGWNDETVAVIQTKTTKRGQKSTIHLPDGTIVKLNSESELSFSDFTGTGAREVSLKGEAFFDVAKDPERPFIVKSGGLQTTVLGTSFNISSYHDSDLQQVTVATGKVKVQQEGKNEFVMLLPREQASFDVRTAQLSKNTVDISRFISWKDGIIYLDKVTLADAAGMLEKWYGVNIEFENDGIRSCILSGTYRNDDLKNILDGIKYIKNIDYKIKRDRTIILSGESCK